MKFFYFRQKFLELKKNNEIFLDFVQFIIRCRKIFQFFLSQMAKFFD